MHLMNVIFTGHPISVSQAIQLGLITSDQQTYYNPATDERISIDDAIAQGMVKAEKKEPESLTDSRRRKRSQTDEPQVSETKHISQF